MNKQYAIMKALLDAAKAENRDLTDDEQKQFDAAETEYNRLKKIQDQENKLKEIENSIAAEKPTHEPAPMASSATAGVQVGKDLSTTKPYDSMGDLLKDVAAVEIGSTMAKGNATDRLKNAKLNTESGADGGFLVPTEFIGTMMQDAVTESKLFSQVTEIPVTGNNVSLPGVDETSRADGQRYGGISVDWIGEGNDGNYTRPKFDSLDLKLSKLMALISVTDEMLDDATFLSSWIANAYASEMAFALDQAVFNGDGKGKPLGFMNSDALVTVAKEGSQAADTIVYENIVKMMTAIDPRSFSRSKFYMTQRCWEQLPLMNLAVGTGGVPVFLPPGGASVAPYGTLMGRPIEVIEQANKLGDIGDIVLADLSDYIAISKGGIQTASSIHVDFNKAQTAFRFIKRVNGSPYTRTSLASRADATFKTSPYVALAERA